MREGRSEEGMFKSVVEKRLVKREQGEHSRYGEGMNEGSEGKRR